VAEHSATITMGPQYQNISCNVSASGENVLKGTFSAPYLTGSFTVTRTSETTATCDLKLIVQGDGGTGIGTGTLTGTKQ